MSLCNVSVSLKCLGVSLIDITTQSTIALNMNAADGAYSQLAKETKDTKDSEVLFIITTYSRAARHPFSCTWLLVIAATWRGNWRDLSGSKEYCNLWHALPYVVISHIYILYYKILKLYTHTIYIYIYMYAYYCIFVKVVSMVFLGFGVS